MADWQPIERWLGRYEVSRDGEVRRSDGLVLKQWKNEQGYMLVRLSKPRAVERVHRLVAESFNANLNSKPFVNHINNDRSDNRSENLEWCTQWENISHASRQGRMSRHWSGKRSPNAKLTDAAVACIRSTYAAGACLGRLLASASMSASGVSVASCAENHMCEFGKWLDIETAPKDGTCSNVLVAYKNSHGKWRRVIAFYAPNESLESDDLDCDEAYVPEGWYEYSDASGQYFRCDCEPTHWQPLPEPPSC